MTLTKTAVFAKRLAYVRLLLSLIIMLIKLNTFDTIKICLVSFFVQGSEQS